MSVFCSAKKYLSIHLFEVFKQRTCGTISEIFETDTQTHATTVIYIISPQGIYNM